MVSTETLRIAAGCLLSACLVFSQQPAKRLLKIEDMHRFHNVGDPQISPDGKWVAYTVGTIDTAADKSDTDIWMTSWDGTQHLRVVGSLRQPAARIYVFDVAAKKLERLTESKLEAAAPAVSPDGKRIAFMARSGKDADRYNTSNVFAMDAQPGATPKQLTNYD